MSNFLAALGMSIVWCTLLGQRFLVIEWPSIRCVYIRCLLCEYLSREIWLILNPQSPSIAGKIVNE